MDKHIGFIGSGNMAKAIIGGLLESNFIKREHIYASNRSKGKLESLGNEYGIQVSESNSHVAENVDIVFLSVTPDQYPTVIEEVRDRIKQDAIIVLIAGGQSIEQNESRFMKEVKMVKAMPNTPVLVKEGLTTLSFNELMTDTDRQFIVDLFNKVGKTEVIDEKLMDIASAVGGSSPAFIYMYIEALADAAVLYGIPREQAYAITAQAVLGSAKMVLETNTHPAQLKDEVCSPGGTTIQSMAALEKNGFRSAIIEAVHANMAKLTEK
ncbi:pyrroline-5-carboxylate reductase [Bacillus sp. TS-2]|nr:pyrroline-5-carboxylate reductase [Bacillus sp. TS-2]